MFLHALSVDRIDFPFEASLAACDVNPDKLVMHDHWIALVAVFFGKIVFLDEATLSYRQHGDNSCGARSMLSIGYNLSRRKTREL